MRVLLAAAPWDVLLIWIPLREAPGIGTVANALVVGLSADGTPALLDAPHPMILRIGLTLGGVLLCGLAGVHHRSARGAPSRLSDPSAVLLPG